MTIGPDGKPFPQPVATVVDLTISRPPIKIADVRTSRIEVTAGRFDCFSEDDGLTWYMLRYPDIIVRQGKPEQKEGPWEIELVAFQE